MSIELTIVAAKSGNDGEDGGSIWRSQRDLNPRYRIDNPMSLTRLNDGFSLQEILAEGERFELPGGFPQPFSRRRPYQLG